MLLRKVVITQNNKDMNNIVQDKDDKPTMPVSAYVLSMISVGLLFYVIGYGYCKGKESA